MIVVPRYDICFDHDIIVIEIEQRLHQPILVVNIYNPPTASVGAHSTGQRMKLLNSPDTYLTVIRRLQPAPPDWEEITTEPTAAAKSMVEWLQDKSFSLLNVHNYPTFFTTVIAYTTRYAA